MTSAFTPDRLAALIATVRLWALVVAAWLAEILDDDALRARVAHDLGRAERGLKAIVMLLALRGKIRAPGGPHASHPNPVGNAPRGFAERAVRANDMRRLTRTLFARCRDLRTRLARLQTFVDALDVHVARMARRLDWTGPDTRLIAIAPPSPPCATQARPDACGFDSS